MPLWAEIFNEKVLLNFYTKYPICFAQEMKLKAEIFSTDIVWEVIEILEPVLRDAGQEMWQALDRIIPAKNAMEGIVAKEMYIQGFLDYERLVCEKDNNI
mgnify:CR=1 FL=1